MIRNKVISILSLQLALGLLLSTVFCPAAYADECEHTNLDRSTIPTYEIIVGNNDAHNVVVWMQTTCLDCWETLDDVQLTTTEEPHQFEAEGSVLTCKWCEYQTTKEAVEATTMPTAQPTATPTPRPTATPKPTATSKPTATPKALKIGDIVTMGTYEQDSRKSNGAEDIEWLVLDIQNNKALLISRYVLDHVDYHTKQTSVTWETCYMRRWLNSEFIQTAFTEDEQEMILTTTVKAQKNPHLSSTPKNGIGNDTKDKIFLLNVVEAEKYFDSDWDRQCKGTEYALDQNVSTDGVYCNWLLRQPHKFGTTVPCVNFEGSTNDGVNVSAERTGTRPAMWVDINMLLEYDNVRR